MGVRVDRAGTLDWDYHTAGAKIGIRMAKGGIKRTASTGEYETLLSRRQYLYDASFLVAVQGDASTVNACASALNNPVWPSFLGRKCCVPAEPVYVGTGEFDTITDALSSLPWRPRITAIDRSDRGPTCTLDAFIEHVPGSPPPPDARLVHDVPQAFGFNSHSSRWVVAGKVTVPVGRGNPDAHVQGLLTPAGLRVSRVESGTAQPPDARSLSLRLLQVPRRTGASHRLFGIRHRRQSPLPLQELSRCMHHAGIWRWHGIAAGRSFGPGPAIGDSPAD